MFDNVENLGPGVEIYHNAYESPQDIIASAFMSDGWRSPEVFSTENAKYEEDTSYRSCRIFDLVYDLEASPEEFAISKTIFEVGKDYAKKYKIGFGAMERPQILHYAENAGHYNSHYDDAPGNPRVFSAVFYLNDVEEGGETEFDYFDISVKPTAGSILMFPANYIYSHKANPPISSDKICIVTWFSPITISQYAMGSQEKE